MYLSIYLTIELATDFSLYLDTNLQVLLAFGLKIEDSTETLSSNLQPSQSAGGIDDPKKKSCGIFNLKRKRLPSVYPFHSIPSVRPSYPSTHIVHPSILSVHLHSYLFTYLPIYLYIYQSI